MKVVIAGGTGFLGRPLADRLASAGNEVVILSRRGAPRGSTQVVAWQPGGSATGEWPRAINGADAIVNLAGENLAGPRWTPERKAVLRSSRILSTRSLVAAVRAASHKPATFLSGSAIGYYGDAADDPLDESFPPGSDFLATLCVDWEAEAHAASALGCRVVIVRTGVVLARDGGALGKLILPFQFFVGGPIASGRQFFSWIHRDDWISLVEWALGRPEASGPFNGTAPQPVPNREFSEALGRALHRPSWLPAPGFALKILVGEMADATLIGGQRVIPKRALDAGFRFMYPTIDEAMVAAVRRKAG